MTLTNTGSATDVIDQVQLGGADQLDFVGSTDCGSATGPVSLSPGTSCQVVIDFLPSSPTPRSATVQFADDEAQPLTITMAGTGTEGYYEAGADGHVYRFGDAQSHGDASGLRTTAPVVSMASAQTGTGTGCSAATGGIFSYGNARFLRLDRWHAPQPARGSHGLPPQTVGGYWLVASDGGMFAFGDAPFFGSTGAMRLNQPIVGMAPTPDGGGYWLVARDGGIFAFGDARFFGSTGTMRLRQPRKRAWRPHPDGGGYWLVARDGGIFAFGDARFFRLSSAILWPGQWWAWLPALQAWATGWRRPTAGSSRTATSSTWGAREGLGSATSSRLRRPRRRPSRASLVFGPAPPRPHGASCRRLVSPVEMTDRAAPRLVELTPKVDPAAG